MLATALTVALATADPVKVSVTVTVVDNANDPVTAVADAVEGAVIDSVMAVADAVPD